MTVAERREDRAKILMVLSALNQPTSARNLSLHPTLAGMSAQKASAYLRHMESLGQTRRNKDGAWLAKSTNGNGNGSTATVTEQAKDNVFFLIDSHSKTLYLEVGGMRFPVRFL